MACGALFRCCAMSCRFGVRYLCWLSNLSPSSRSEFYVPNRLHAFSFTIWFRAHTQEQVLAEQLKRSRLQEQKAMMENEALRKQLEEMVNKRKTEFIEFHPLDRTISINGSKPAFNYALESNKISDTSLQLGLSSDYDHKRKECKIEPSNNSGSQVASQ